MIDRGAEPRAVHSRDEPIARLPVRREVALEVVASQISGADILTARRVVGARAGRPRAPRRHHQDQPDTKTQT